MTVEEVKALNPQLIILSPGPGRPEQAGICEEVVEQDPGSEHSDFRVYALGHQAICEAYRRQNHPRKEADAWKDLNQHV